MRHSAVATILAMVLMVSVAVACEETDEATEAEQNSQSVNYSSQVNRQPAEQMDYSPTREGLNKWMNTWEEPGKIAYVYLYAANGEDLGYFVLEGLPVSYCASLTPTERILERRGDSGIATGVAPSMDGVYYSGNQCIQFFGFDAVSGAYLEWSAGGSFNFFVSDQPLPRPESEPLGQATVEEVQQREGND
jgi:hypothetical protein